MREHHYYEFSSMGFWMNEKQSCNQAELLGSVLFPLFRAEAADTGPHRPAEHPAPHHRPARVHLHVDAWSLHTLHPPTGLPKQ